MGCGASSPKAPPSERGARALWIPGSPLCSPARLRAGPSPLSSPNLQRSSHQRSGSPWLSPLGSWREDHSASKSVLGAVAVRDAAMEGTAAPGSKGVTPRTLRTRTSRTPRSSFTLTASSLGPPLDTKEPPCVDRPTEHMLSSDDSCDYEEEERAAAGGAHSLTSLMHGAGAYGTSPQSDSFLRLPVRPAEG